MSWDPDFYSYMSINSNRRSNFSDVGSNLKGGRYTYFLQRFKRHSKIIKFLKKERQTYIQIDLEWQTILSSGRPKTSSGPLCYVKSKKKSFKKKSI